MELFRDQSISRGEASLQIWHLANSSRLAGDSKSSGIPTRQLGRNTISDHWFRINIYLGRERLKLILSFRSQ